MTSPLPKAKQTSRWGSLLTGAISGIESRLDTILAEEPDASAKSRAAEKVLAEAKSEDGSNLAAPNTVSRSSSRASSRAAVNDRLQERLAKVMASKTPSTTASEAPSPSQPGSPVKGSGTSRTSISSRPSMDVPRSLPSLEQLSQKKDVADVAATPPENDTSGMKPGSEPKETLLSSSLPINPARSSQDFGSRPSIEVSEVQPLELEDIRQINGTSTPPTTKTAAEMAVEMEQMRKDHEEAEEQRQEEMHANLERIDALQAKLQYLAKETVNAAKEANANTPAGSLESKMAEKDQQIAQLMEEGQNLSKTEMRHLITIRKLTAKMKEEDKSASGLRVQMSNTESRLSELSQRLKRSEEAEKQNRERLKKLPRMESEVLSLKTELESVTNTTIQLKDQLNDAEKQAEEERNGAQKTAAQVDQKRLIDLQEELENLRIEKNLAEERSGAEIRRLKAENERQKQTSQTAETELRSEIQNLESRMESLRVRAEEASSDSGGDTQAKLLRQIETLQTQYSLAAENWRTIEGSLNGRMTAVSKERDEASKREADVRKKARDMGSKSRKLEEELENALEQSRIFRTDLDSQRDEITKMNARLQSSDKALEDAKADFDRQRKIWEVDMQQRLEEEKTRQTTQPQGLGFSNHRSTQSPTSYFRKTPAIDRAPVRKTPSRLFSSDSSSSMAYSRRPSAHPPAIGILDTSARASMTPELMQSPGIGVSRPNSAISLAGLNGQSTPITSSMPPTPAELDTVSASGYDDQGSNSPNQTINDVISASTAHTGPSVQLVERMSSSIRRLEAEKAAHKDDLARLQAQRDEARDQLVGLMREVEGLKDSEDKAKSLEKEVGDVKKRYEACLEMLGEREEEVTELKEDVGELKRVYRELAETMGR